MLRRVILILIGVLVFGGSGVIFAQTKITLDTKTFPKDFEGHDAAVLFANLNALLKSSKGKNVETIRESLQGKTVYKNLTTDDLFAFSLDSADSVIGRSAINDSRYRGSIFPLRSLKDAPPPRLRYLGGGGTGSGIGTPDPQFSSVDELVTRFGNSPPLETIWTESYLPIETVFPPEALAKKYVGNTARPYFSVPTPQIHYGLAFLAAQPFSLVKVVDEKFSLQTDRFNSSESPGIVAWLENGEQYGGNNAPLFIVKLVAPYIISETYETPDAAEGKPHIAVRDIIYVELKAIWIYNRSTGAIISKSGEQFVVPTKISANASPNAPLKIISTPRPVYTDKARQNSINGVVTLKVAFLASGQIGEITVVKGLRYGLTEKAMEAARKIRFSPAFRNGVPMTVTKIMEFNFKVF